jgi:S-methylmethionine-dependent homocysteine/selenocysteine methylase
MIDDIPDAEALRQHHTNIGIVAALINMTSAYLNSPDGSGEEEMAELELADAIQRMSQMPEEIIGNALLALTSLIVGVAEPEEVQAWFDHQAQKIAEAME